MPNSSLTGEAWPILVDGIPKEDKRGLTARADVALVAVEEAIFDPNICPSGGVA